MPPRDKFRTLDDPDPSPDAPGFLQAVEQRTRMADERSEKEKGSMSATVSLIFLLLAVLAFFLAAFNATPSARVNPTALGLCFWAASQLIRSVFP